MTRNSVLIPAFVIVVSFLIASRVPQSIAARPTAAQPASCADARERLDREIERQRERVDAGELTEVEDFRAAIIEAFRSCFAAELRPAMAGAGSCEEHIAVYRRSQLWQEELRLNGVEDDLAMEVDEVLAYRPVAFRACYEERIAPGIAASFADCAAKRRTLEEATTWLREVEVEGLADELASEKTAIDTFEPTVWVTCYEEAYRRCLETLDPAHAEAMQAALRELELLGHGARVDREKIEHCRAQELELVFDSAIVVTYNSGYFTYRSRVRATVPLRRDPQAGVFSGEGPLEAVSYTVETARSCPSSRIEEFRATSNVRVLEATIALPPSPTAEPGVVVVMLPGGTTASERHSYNGCGSLPDYTAVSLGNWSRAFYDLHDRLGETEFSYRGTVTIRGWSAGSGDVIAQKTYRQTFTSGDVSRSEVTTLELRRVRRP